MSLRAGRGSPEYERQDAIDIAEQARGRAMRWRKCRATGPDRRWRLASAHPGAWLKLQLRKTVLLWNATEIPRHRESGTYAEWSLPLRVLGVVGHFWCLVPLALFGLLLSWRDRRRASGLWWRWPLPTPRASSCSTLYAAGNGYPLVPICALRRDRTDSAADVSCDRSSRSRARRRVRLKPDPYDRLRQDFGGCRSHRIAVVVAGVASIVFTNWSIVSADMNGR